MAATRKAGSSQAARNERIQLLTDGKYKNEYQYRKAMHAGETPAMRPERLKPKYLTRQAKWYDNLSEIIAPKKKSKRRPAKGTAAGRRLFDLESAKISRESECQAWSDHNAVTTTMRFDFEKDNSKKLKNAVLINPEEWMRRADETPDRKIAWIAANGYDAYVDIYFRAFVDREGGETFRAVKDKNGRIVEHRRGSEALRIWLVEICGYLGEMDYDNKYKL